MISAEERNEYLIKVGNRGKKYLSIIESLAPFVEMSVSDLGKEFLSEDIEAHGNLINKIYNSLISTGSAEQKDVIELRLLDAHLKKIYDRLKNYYIGVKIVKKVASDE